MWRRWREHRKRHIYALWTRQAVSELVEAVYGVRLTVRNTGKYLKRWGFTPQRPLKKAYEQSPDAVSKWVNEEYPKIAKRAKTEGAEIQWGDEAGLRSDDVRGRGYAPKGQTPVVLTNANRAKLSVILTVTNKGQMRWRVFSGALNAHILIGFLERLVRNREQKIFLILDNLRVHHSKPVKQWLAKHADKIEVFYLPSYPPELNRDELLNADLKCRVTKAAPPRTKTILSRTAIGALRSIQKQPDRVESYFRQKDVSYAAWVSLFRPGSIVLERCLSPLATRSNPKHPKSRFTYPLCHPTTRPKALPVRTERLNPESIATLRRQIATHLARSLPRCPCCLLASL